MVVPKLLPALQVLMKSGVLTLPIQSSETNTGRSIAADAHEEEIDQQTGEDLGRLGSNFL
jgi:hypothetical protein